MFDHVSLQVFVKLDVFVHVVKHRFPRRQQSQNVVKSNSEGQMILVKCACNPYMNLQSEIGYFMTTQTLDITHFVCERDKITDKQTKKQTN